jgi:hypothetical protein
VKFVDRFEDNPDELLNAAARLTLRLALRCVLVDGRWGDDPDLENDDDPDSWGGIYERIRILMGAYIRSREGVSEDKGPDICMAHLAASIAAVIANIPSLRAAIAADVVLKPDEDP